MTDSEVPGLGEAAESGRRKVFWNSLGLIMIGGMIAGAFFGFYMAIARKAATAADAIGAMPNGLLISLCVAGFLAFAYGCWRFYKAIDEVELQDNLWGSAAAYYVYAVAFPLWWVLAAKGLVPPLDGWLLYFAALVAGSLAYVWRKWRAR